MSAVQHQILVTDWLLYCMTSLTSALYWVVVLWEGHLEVSCLTVCTCSTGAYCAL